MSRSGSACGSGLSAAALLTAFAASPALTLLASPLRHAAAECAARGWMCLLAGPAASGKTAAVRTLASLCGQPLLELSLTSGTDTSDLLGGFEQVEPAHKVQELAREAQTLLAAAAELLGHLLHCCSEAGPSQLAETPELIGAQCLTAILRWASSPRRQSPPQSQLAAAACVSCPLAAMCYAQLLACSVLAAQQFDCWCPNIPY